MKWFWIALIFIVFVTPIIFIGLGVDHLDIMKERYKRALDAGADAAARYRPYTEADCIEQQGTAFGEGGMDTKNIPLDPDEALKWFYRVFYRNIGIESNPAMQEKLKKYIPMKAIVGFDKIKIADLNDNWVVDEYYEIEYNDALYRFTLSDKIQNKATGEWKTDTELGISPEKREELVNTFIKQKIDGFLSSRQNVESGYSYSVSIMASDMDLKSDDVDGVNFIVMTEGMPLPSMNPWRNEKLYAFSLGGSEISR